MSRRIGLGLVFHAFFLSLLTIGRVSYGAEADDDTVRGPDDTVAAEAPTLGEEQGYDPDETVCPVAPGEDEEFRLANWFFDQPPQPPVAPIIEPPTFPLPPAAAALAQNVFMNEDIRRSLIASYRRTRLPGPATELVFGSESQFRVTTDTGNLLGKSLSAPSVRVQQRTPVVSDTRVRGGRGGRTSVSGSYWVPARDDLDTALSKIDSRIIQDVVVIKGPYTAQLGPGFYFVDFQLVESPRYDCGPRMFASTGLEYQTNGEQWYGRQSAWGGGEDWGFRVGYGHRTGNDYSTGSSAFDADGTLPTSYNSRDLHATFAYDPSLDSRVEFYFLRLDQTDVEFPGLVFDINALVTNGFELKYSRWDQPGYDLMTLEGWYNRTAFHGDTSRSGKNRQIPSIRDFYFLGPDQFLVTDVDGMSAGYRAAWAWGDTGCPQLTLGTDLIRVGQQLNDIVPETIVPLPTGPTPFPSQNTPIPRSHSLDVGLFAEYARPFDEGLTVRTGTRVDLVSTTARDRVPGMGVLSEPPPPDLIETGLSDLKQSELDQHFYPWAVYGTAEYAMNASWTLIGGVSYAMRPPTLTELYAAGPWIGSLQPGLTYLEGDPQLDPERLIQTDLGVRVDYGDSLVSLTGFYAWVFDYITYDDIQERYQSDPPLDLEDLPFTPGEDFQHVAFVNTDLATLIGFELLGEHDFNNWLTGFAVMSYVEGWDHTRTEPSRVAAIIRDESGLPADAPRSFDGDRQKEPLPGIPPLESRVGLRVHEARPNPFWGVELEARMVDGQNRVARTLSEQATPRFTVWNTRGFWRPFDDFTMYGGVENFTDRSYREHLDYRAGRGVFRPGINFYVLTDWVY